MFVAMLVAMVCWLLNAVSLCVLVSSYGVLVAICACVW